MQALLISDLHLQGADDALADILWRLLAGPARQARRLFILGDLFEAYLGDDDDAPLLARFAGACSELAATGVEVAFQHGNRDFLLGRNYASRCGLRLLPDPCVIELAGQPVLLSHGDSWCLDDAAYQAARRQLRDPTWQAGLLAQPLAARRAFAQAARQRSAEHQRGLAMELMDVNGGEIERVFRLYGVDRIIHGHTHRPAEHAVRIDDRDCQRWVLADWRKHGEALAIDDDGRWQRLPLY